LKLERERERERLKFALPAREVPRGNRTFYRPTFYGIKGSSKGLLLRMISTKNSENPGSPYPRELKEIRK
jgi:hypothetical protein